MDTKNLPKAKTKKNEITFIANGENITLTPETVKNYLVSGDKGKVTTQEIVMFMNLCKFNGLNPWLKEAYLIKFGNEPATIVAGKESFTKKAEANPKFDGFEAGIIVLDNETQELIYRNGSMKLPNETIVGGYAEVWRKDHGHSYREEVSFEEYAGRKKDGTLNRQWASKPATMIRKVALVHALREAFPGTLGGMYSAEEYGIEEPIDVDATEIVDATVSDGTEDAFAGKQVEGQQQLDLCGGADEAK